MTGGGRISFEDRIIEARKTSDANGIGTALFLAGVIPLDTYIEPGSAQQHLENLVRVTEPKTGCLAVFRNPDFPAHVVHIGVVVSCDQVQITHRRGYGGLIHENDGLTAVMNELRYQGKVVRTRTIEYYELP